jgi:hypothetical protein
MRTRPLRRREAGRRAGAARALVTTLTAAGRLGGVPEPACLAFAGATDAMAFETYAERCLAPSLRPGDIVVMDNLGSHERPPPIAAIEGAGATVRFLQPYSPDLNPIEDMFSKLKKYLRVGGRRTIPELIGAFSEGLQTVTDHDILGWFRSC